MAPSQLMILKTGKQYSFQSNPYDHIWTAKVILPVKFQWSHLNSQWWSSQSNPSDQIWTAQMIPNSESPSQTPLIIPEHIRWYQTVILPVRPLWLYLNISGDTKQWSSQSNPSDYIWTYQVIPNSDPPSQTPLISEHIRWYQTVILPVRPLWLYQNISGDTKQWSSQPDPSDYIWTYQVIPNSDPPSQTPLIISEHIRWYQTVILPVRPLWLYLNISGDTKQWSSQPDPSNYIWTYQVIPNNDPPSQTPLIISEHIRWYQTVNLPVRPLWLYLNISGDTKQWSSQSDPSDYIWTYQVIPNSDPPSQTPLIISEHIRWYQTVILPVRPLWSYLNISGDTKQWSSQSDPSDIWTYQVIPNSDPPSQTPLIISEHIRWYQTVILPVKPLWYLNISGDTKQWSSQSDPSDYIRTYQVIPNSDPPSQTPLIISEHIRWYQTVILPVRPLWLYLNISGDTKQWSSQPDPSNYIWTYQVIPNSDPPSQTPLIISEHIRWYQTVILPVRPLWLYLNISGDTKQWTSQSDPSDYIWTYQVIPNSDPPSQTPLISEHIRWYQTVILPVRPLWLYLNISGITKQWSSQSDPSDYIRTYQVIPNSDPPSQTPLIISEHIRWYQTVILPVRPLWLYLNISGDTKQWSSQPDPSNYTWTYQVIPNSDPPSQTPLIISEHIRWYQTVILPVRPLWLYLNISGDTKQWSSQSDPSDYIWTYQVIPNSDPPSQTPLIISEHIRWYQTVILPARPLWLYQNISGDTKQWSSQSDPSDYIWTYQVIPNSDPPSQTPLIISEHIRWYQTVILPVRPLWLYLNISGDTKQWSSQSDPSDYIWTYQVIPNSDPPSQTPLIISEHIRWYQTVILPARPLWLYLNISGDNKQWSSQPDPSDYIWTYQVIPNSDPPSQTPLIISEHIRWYQTVILPVRPLWLYLNSLGDT